MKILHFAGNIYSKSSGVRNVIEQLTKFQKLTNEVHILCIESDKEKEKNFLQNKWEGATPHFIKSYFFGNFGFSLKYFSLVKKINPDVIHVHGLWMFNSFVAFILSKKYKIVISPHGMLSDEALSYNKIIKRIFLKLYIKKLLRLSKIIATSEKEKFYISKFSKNKIKIIPNGIWIPEKFLLEKDIVSKKKKIITVGRLHKKKNIDNLIHIWNKINNNFRDWELKIIGSGDKKYTNYLKDLSISKNINFEEEKFGSKLFFEYKSAALFICISKDENFGMTIGEAMRSGTPVIVSDNLPWNSINNKGVGWSISLKDQNLEKTLKVLLKKDIKYFEKIGKKSKEYVKKEFNWQKIQIEITNFYNTK